MEPADELCLCILEISFEYILLIVDIISLSTTVQYMETMGYDFKLTEIHCIVYL